MTEKLNIRAFAFLAIFTIVFAYSPISHANDEDEINIDLDKFKIGQKERDTLIHQAKKLIRNINATHKSQTSASNHEASRSLKRSNIVISFNLEDLLSISFRGFFTTHDTMTSGGDHNDGIRETMEKIVAGKYFSTKLSKRFKAHLRPKSAFLVDFNPRSDIPPSIDGRYGEVFFVLKENVKDRSTWAKGDSKKIYNYNTKDFHEGEWISKEHISTFSYGSPRSGKHAGYFEAQVWGPLDITDVAEIILPSDILSYHHDKSRLKALKDSIELVKGLGVPISVYKHAPNGEPKQSLFYRLRKRKPLEQSSKKGIHYKWMPTTPYEYGLSDKAAKAKSERQWKRKYLRDFRPFLNSRRVDQQLNRTRTRP